MSDMISKDKAIAALSEINKLRHIWNQSIGPSEERCKTAPHMLHALGFRDGVIACHVNLTAAIELAYEILNKD